MILSPLRSRRVSWLTMTISDYTTPIKCHNTISRLNAFLILDKVPVLWIYKPLSYLVPLKLKHKFVWSKCTCQEIVWNEALPDLFIDFTHAQKAANFIVLLYGIYASYRPAYSRIQ